MILLVWQLKHSAIEVEVNLEGDWEQRKMNYNSTEEECNILDNF